MPPFYPSEYEDQSQYSNQYLYGVPSGNDYQQYQYSASPDQQPQHFSPFSQVQVNVPTRQHQQQQQQYQYQQQSHMLQPQQPNPSHYAYSHNFHSNYSPQTPQFPYQYQPQQQYPAQIQQQHQQQIQYQRSPVVPPQNVPNILPEVQQQEYYQPMPQYVPPQQQIQVNIPKVQPSSQQNQQHSAQTPRVLKDVQPTAPRQQQSVTPKPKPQPQPVKETPTPEPEYHLLLLTLADEYLETAQKLPFRSAEYYKLMATALGCIDAVLNNFKLTPLREAQVSLRYSQLLLNETENYDDAERILTKTIDLCERLKYHDLKYSAQLLLTRILYQSRPKAALKDLQGMIQDIEAYKHTAWEYAFRFQYTMFAVSSSQPTDNHVAITQLDRICHLARQSGDNAVLAFAAVLLGLVHLQSTSAESVQSSQRALAKARALQLNPDVEGSPQLCVMIEFIDLCGQVKSFDLAQSEQKRKAMQSVVQSAIEKDDSWRDDGLMFIPVSQTSLRGLQVQDGGLVMERNGKYYLAFSWLPREEVEGLGYLLSGVSIGQKTAGEGGKAEKFYDEGLDVIKEALDEKRPATSAGDIRYTRQKLIRCHFLFQKTFLQCSRGQWERAQATMRTIRKLQEDLQEDFTTDLQCLADYIDGSICQGLGDLEHALILFQSSSLNISSYLDDQGIAKPQHQLHRRDETIRNIAILATMNTIFITQQPQHPQSQGLPILLRRVEPLASHHPNKAIQAAWNFVLASLPSNTILKTKQYLGIALGIAQSISNAQITTMCLVTMQEKFFKGVVGEQALKCAKAASHQAKRLNEPVWIATASGLEADCLGVHGMNEESAKKSEEVDQILARLPTNVRNAAMSL